MYRRRIADIVNAPGGLAVFVFDDAHQRVNTVADKGKAAVLLSSINQFDG
jgi:hypothetical protein